MIAANGLVGRPLEIERDPQLLLILIRYRCRATTCFTQAAHQSLGKKRPHRSRQKEGLDAHVGQTTNSPESVVGMERTKDQVTRQRGPDRNLSSLQVTNLTNHYDIRVCP